MKCIQFMMFTMNVVFWAIGGTMLGVGIWMAVDSNALNALYVANAAGMNDALFAAAVYTTIGIGALIFLVGFLGCFGAMRADSGGSNKILNIYHSLVSFIIIAEVICIILVAIFWSQIDESIQTGMTVSMQSKYSMPNQDTLTNSWDSMQKKWTCCGGKNYEDYAGSNYFRITNYSVPDSCCIQDSNNQPINQAACLIEGAALTYDPNGIYTALNAQGCYDGMRNFVITNSAILIGILCGFIGLEFLGLLFACLLVRCK